MTTTPSRAALFGLSLGLAACVEAPEADPAPSTTPHQGTHATPHEGSAATDPWIDGTDPHPDTPTTDGDPLPMTGFSFVRDHLAGMPYPYGDDLEWVAAQQVQLVVSLTEAPLDEAAVAEVGMELLHLPIEDFHAPTPDQQIAFVREVVARQEAGDKVVVHCLAGVGRTGTMLATWLVFEGLAAEEAIEEVRRLRPGSIETADQEEAVRRFARAMEAR